MKPTKARRPGVLPPPLNQEIKKKNLNKKDE
jgi:hypothetical protein